MDVSLILRIRHQSSIPSFHSDLVHIFSIHWSICEIDLLQVQSAAHRMEIPLRYTVRIRIFVRKLSID